MIIYIKAIKCHILMNMGFVKNNYRKDFLTKMVVRKEWAFLKNIYLYLISREPDRKSVFIFY